MNTTSIFFNHSFDKKKLKAFIYWVLKTFGEKDALTIVEELKRMGFYNATKAGLSIGLNDLKTPSKKKVLISQAQITMSKTDQEFKGAELTATERSQRIIDTWHRTSEDLRKQVVDYFSTYDQLNSVYMMALSGARGNFSQVRQLIGMRGLMADPQGQIISFPIRSNLREGLTLTEYFISCSGARKGLVDTALRTADTGYLTRRLVDISHHIVVKKVTCYTSRGIALKTLRTSHKILLPLKDRLVGRVLGENVYGEDQVKVHPEQSYDGMLCQNEVEQFAKQGFANCKATKQSLGNRSGARYLTEITEQGKQGGQSKNVIARRNQEISPHLALKISLVKEKAAETTFRKNKVFARNRSPLTNRRHAKTEFLHDVVSGKSFASTTQEIENKPDSGKHKISVSTPWVLVRSPLTCTYTHEVCQLCYGWSMAQGNLVSLGEAVGVLAGQSIGEPGTQLTMRTFHTGGVFSGDLLQEIRAPHSGKIWFPKALQGLLIRTSQGKIAFLIKVSGELLIDSGDLDDTVKKREATKLLLEPSTILFVRQGEKVKSHQILAELAITSEEGNQPINSRQTLFSEMRGRIVQWKSMLSRTHTVKGTAKKENLDLGEDVTLNKTLPGLRSLAKTEFLQGNQSREVPYGGSPGFAGNVLPMTETNLKKKLGIQAYLGPDEVTQNSERQDFILNTSSYNTQALFTERNVQHYEETWGNINNLTLKKVVLSKKHGLGSIEPPKALKLGLLSVIATRVGASEKTCTKVITYNKANQNLVKETKPLPNSYFETASKLNSVPTQTYLPNKDGQNEVQAKQSSALLHRLQKQSFCIFTSAMPDFTFFKYNSSSKYRSLTSINSLFTEALLRSKKTKLCYRFVTEQRLDQAARTFNYSKLQFEQGFNFATNFKFRKAELKSTHKLNKTNHSSFDNSVSVNLTHSNDINNESVTVSKNRYDFTYLNTRVTCLQHLNTIAEEGDLVDEKYTSV